MTNFFYDKNMAVITSRFVVAQNSPIIYVSHNHEDGIWEFYGVEDLKEDDYRVVSLAEILELDSSVFELQYMELGKYALRNSKADLWIINKL